MNSTDELLQIFYDLDRVEKGEIIDFDLVGQKKNFPQKYSTRREVYKALQNIHPESDFIGAKILASLTYIDTLDGKKIAFPKYIESTMGISPMLFTKEYLDSLQANVKRVYSELGYAYTKEDLPRFVKDNSLEKKEIQTTFIKFRDKWLPQFLNWLDLSVDLDYEIKFVDEDVYWMNWISTRPDGKIELKYNLNKRHTWLRGITEYLVLHELFGHLMQMLSWKKQILEGIMNPFVGLTTVFTPEQFTSEGIAETLVKFLPFDPLSKQGYRALIVDHYDWSVKNNLHIMANTNVSRGEMFLFVSRYLPRYIRESLDKDIKEKTQNPLMRAYQYIYGISLFHHLKFASKMTPKQKLEYVRYVYTHAVTPKELIRRYS